MKITECILVLLLLSVLPACGDGSDDGESGGQDVTVAPDAGAPDGGSEEDAVELDAALAPADGAAVDTEEQAEVTDASSEDVPQPPDEVVEDGDAVADAASPADASGEVSSEDASDAAVDTGEEEDPCEACLASGGTWQPEANACTENCAIMDISCYTSSCPEPCSAASCGTCIGQEECEAAGCTWNAQGPAMWCN